MRNILFSAHTKYSHANTTEIFSGTVPHRWERQGQIRRGEGWIGWLAPPLQGHLRLKLGDELKLSLRRLCFLLFRYRSVRSAPPPSTPLQKFWIRHWKELVTPVTNVPRSLSLIYRGWRERGLGIRSLHRRLRTLTVTAGNRGYATSP